MINKDILQNTRIVLKPYTIRHVYDCQNQMSVIARLVDFLLEGSVYGPVHHWGLAACHPEPLHQAVSEEGLKNCQRPQPPKSKAVLSTTAWQAVPEC